MQNNNGQRLGAFLRQLREERGVSLEKMGEIRQDYPNLI